MRASYRWQFRECVEDDLPDGRHGWSRGRSGGFRSTTLRRRDCSPGAITGGDCDRALSGGWSYGLGINRQIFGGHLGNTV